MTYCLFLHKAGNPDEAEDLTEDTFLLLSRFKIGVGARVLLARSCYAYLFSFLFGLTVFISGIACSFAENPDSAEPQANSTPAPSTSTPVALWDNGLHVHLRNGKEQLEIGGMLQLDDRLFMGPAITEGVPFFTLRRGRLLLEGKDFKRLDFRVMAESREGRPVVVRDAYVDVDISKRMWIQAGKFKSPVGLERLQSPRDLMFAERALVTNLIPDRDIGIQLHGETLSNKISYMGGLFRGVPDAGSSENRTNHGADAEFRVFTHPFRSAHASILGGLGLGVGGSVGRERGSLPIFTTAGLAKFFSYRPGAIADGERTRISPQADYYWHRVGVMAEYALSAQDVRLGEATRRLANTAWQASASYVLTGENASYCGVTPTHAFNPADHHWGAFEIATRFNSLRIDPRVYPVLADPHSAAQKAEGYQMGLNWYAQKHVKIVFDYAKTRFTDGAASGNRPTENVFILRLQLSYY